MLRPGHRIPAVWLLVMMTACSAPPEDKPPVASDSPASEATAPPLSIYAVNYPLAYFAERIGGPRVRVTLPVPAGEDPAYWTPGAEEIVAFQGADLVLLNGAGYAKWLATASLPESRLIDTSAALADRLLPLQETVTHRHGPGGEHSHVGTAFTIWLDPELAGLQAAAIAEALTALSPGDEALFARGLAELQADLQGLDRELGMATRDLRQVPLVFSHPVFQYLVARYDLDAVAVHWEPDEAPDDAMWLDLQKILETHPARWMVWEGEPLDETAARLREQGVEGVVFAPSANRPAEGDYLSVMLENLSQLRRIGEEVAPR